MPDLLQNLFEFLPSLLFSFPDDLRGLNALSGGRPDSIISIVGRKKGLFHPSPLP